MQAMLDVVVDCRQARRTRLETVAFLVREFGLTPGQVDLVLQKADHVAPAPKGLRNTISAIVVGIKTKLVMQEPAWLVMVGA